MAGHPVEVYFEFVPLGRQVKVVAIDAASGVEVSIVAPAGASQRDMETIALRKLTKRLTDLAEGA
ncbi:serine hydroxymethyltransferase [Microvirga tunisiensis]|uniref:Serine hydroxymethyltransferase n=3 Tax=Pannonibacter tanglangensis TaxID=2750084 RepID=A0ABW9ZEU4_9HYPH|nr:MULTISPECIES: serine hydroxymethyltransferase [unclassified Pannonibacter]NBN62527.1 serine hydroxymethyltransferase [Pannonibacter sp. XCT-34]NBN78182.1 serine hydroxymethyltransferase [Pannonibacter sp. XCT-53]